MGSGRHAPWLVAVVALASADAARAQAPVSELQGYLTLSNGYFKHGLSQNDGTSLQLGVDYQHYSGLFLYARAANVEYPQSYWEQERDVEVSAYVGYHDRHETWSWTASVGRYVFPDAANYNYDEVSASVGFRDRVFYTVSYNDEYYLRGVSALNQEVAVAFPLPRDIEIGGALGYFQLRDGGPDIEHWNVGVSKLMGRMALDLRYYDSDYRWSNVLGDANGNRYVLSVSYAVRGNRARSR